MGLDAYREKRDFARTSEPRGAGSRGRRERAYAVQKHDARRLHHDLRLELDGVLKSWAVTRTPPTEPGARVLAVATEDHPLEYGGFEGVIPEGEYGAGTVMLWDRGTWEPEGDPRRALADGKLTFRVRGERLRGRWSLVRMKPRRGGKGRADEWLLIKRSARRSLAPEHEEPERSVASGRTLEEIARGAPGAWPDAVAGAPGARTRAQPRELAPQLATLVDRPPDGDGWLHEIKLDGYRLLAFKAGERVRLATRSGQDWTDRFPRIARAVLELPVEDAVLDGEAVVLARDGRSDFQALQASFGRADAEHVLFVFDLPHAAGHDLTGVPLERRKELLAALLGPRGGEVLRLGEHVRGRGSAFHREACRLGLEGTVSKRADARYAPRRTRTWLKCRCGRRQELVVVGWTDPSGSRAHFGSLLLAYRDDRGALRSCGRVGSGFDAAALASIGALLRERAVDTPPVADPPRGANARGVHWVRPDLLVEVAFTEWTAEGRLRHPTFVGLREDKPAAEAVREAPAPRTTVRLTHPERVLYPELGLTKRELADYYEAVAERMLPHVAGRPLTLVRCPRGRNEECFFQKHLGEGAGAPLRGIPAVEGGETQQYVAVDDADGLVALVQLGVLEVHPWGSRGDRLDRPDRIVFDIDPDEAVGWEEVLATAQVLGERLRGLGLEAFPRTTGGKGLHVVVPLERRAGWSDVKGFARDVARAFERAAPDRYVTNASKAARAGRIFLDYLRNDRGATAIASYSSRARAGAPVAMPLRWEQVVRDLDPTRFTVRSVPALLAEPDPWERFDAVRRSLTAKMRAAARRMR